MTRKRFSACWGNSPIPIERCLRHRAAHPFRMLQRQFLPKKKARCSMSITPTLHRTFHHRLLCLFSSSCRTSCSCSYSFFCSSSFRIFVNRIPGNYFAEFFNRISFVKRAETSKSGVAFSPQGRLFSIFILINP